MRHRKHLIFVAGILAALAALALACGCTPADRFAAGQPISREELASISEALLATEPAEPAETNGGNASESGPSGTVYWTKGGTVYHLDPDCHHLRRAAEVLHGTVREAEAAAMEKACRSCGSHDKE